MRWTVFALVVAAGASLAAGCGKGAPDDGPKPREGGTPDESSEKGPVAKPTPPLDLKPPPAPAREFDGHDLSKVPAGSLRGLAQDAIEDKDFQRAVRFQHWAVANAGSGQYNLACYYSLAGNVDAAVYWLQRAGLEEGVDVGWAGQDSDLARVRQDGRWSTLVDFLRKCNRYWASSDHRDTTLVLPKGYTKEKPIPVLVGLHGMGSNATSFVGRAFQRHADALGVAFVGVSGTIPRGPHSFVWAQDSERNAARIAAALAEVADRLTVKQGAVVAFGFSQGAQAAAEVAVRYPEKYAGAIVLSPGGLEDPKPSAFQPSPAHREQGYVVACGARELPGNVFLTSEYARLTGGMGARVRHKTYPGVSAHTFPPDFDKVLPEWIRFILGPKQS